MGKIAAVLRKYGIVLPPEGQQAILALDEELEALQLEVTTLQAESVRFLADANATEHALSLQKQQERRRPDRAAYQQCPFCQRFTGQFREIRLDNHFEGMRIKRAFYECGKCGYHYDRTILP